MDHDDKQEILEAIAGLAQHMEGEFAKVRSEMHGEFAKVRSENGEDFAKVRNEMATKDFVDRRMTDVVAEIVPVLRKIDAKDTALVQRLAAKSVVTPADAKAIEALSPFAA